MAKKFILLTRAKCRELAPGHAITEHGIEYRKGSDGDGTFTVGVMVDGNRIHRVLGRESEGVNRTLVDKFIAQVKTEARQQRLSLPQGRKLEKPFDQAASEYLQLEENTDGKNLVSKRSEIKNRLIPYFGKKPLSSITTDEVEKYKKHLLTTVRQLGVYRGKDKPLAVKTEGPLLSKATVNRSLAVLSHLLTKARELNWTTAHPQIKKFDEGPGRRGFMTKDQQEALRKAAAESPDPDLSDFIDIGLETSMRAGEIFAIKKEHVHLDRLIIHVPEAKAGPRDQPITTWLVHVLEKRIASLPKNVPWLFPTPRKSKSGHRECIDTPYVKAVIAAKLDPKEVLRHTMRHSAITDLCQAGVDLGTIMDISGHKTIEMVLRYYHASGVHTKAAMKKLEKHRGRNPDPD